MVTYEIISFIVIWISKDYSIVIKALDLYTRPLSFYLNLNELFSVQTPARHSRDIVSQDPEDETEERLIVRLGRFFRLELRREIIDESWHRLRLKVWENIYLSHRSFSSLGNNFIESINIYKYI